MASQGNLTDDKCFPFYSGKSYYQIGAPALVYHEKINHNSSFMQLPSYKLPSRDAKTLQETFLRQMRVQSRWSHSVDLCQIEQVRLPSDKRSKAKRKKSGQNNGDSDTGSPSSNFHQRLTQGRFGMLAHHNMYAEKKHHHLLRRHEKYDHPYIYAEMPKNYSRRGIREPKLSSYQYTLSRDFRLTQERSSNPAYLAPFYIESLEDSQKPMNDEFDVKKNMPDKIKTDGLIPGVSSQGNCLLCLPCPCPNCAPISYFTNDEREHSWCLFHPVSLAMDTLCASNLIPPHGKENAGHVYTYAHWEADQFKRKRRIQDAQSHFPNRICLHDTIMEVKLGGQWETVNNHLRCNLVVRTHSHISVILVKVMKPDLPNVKASNYDEVLCWGNYVLEEIDRIDLRSLVFSTPSYRPCALACHPKYGNALASTKFAFASYSEHNGDQNIIHHCIGNSQEGLTMHSISALKSITSIDFTTTQPMCLWSAASSHVRPALVPDIQFKKQPPMGFGTSLYTIDLRTNSSMFQWSPSAEEMLTEGIHSINSILTDWEHPHTVWTSSKSAGKIWEIDARMPCRALHTWSLSSGCEDESPTFPQNSVYGGPSLLTKTIERPKANTGNVNTAYTKSAPLLGIESTPAAFGVHLYQPPTRRPRFQADSLESITVAAPQIEVAGKTSIATSSVYALPERAHDLHACGIAAFRVPIKNFVSEDERGQLSFGREEDSNVICTLTMTNRGELYCHNLLESSKSLVDVCTSHPELPVGSRAIALTNELDGKTKFIEHKRWKPTGGLNLKLFFTNRFPNSRDSTIYLKSNARQSVPLKLVMKKAEDHRSVKRRKDGDGIFEVRTAPSGMQIVAPESSQLVNSNARPIVLPRSLAMKARKPCKLYESHAGKATKNNDESEYTSDLNPEVLQEASRIWDLWDQEDDSDSDNGKVRFGF